MSDENETPAAELAGQENLFIAPTAADGKPRIVPRAPEVPADPEAPFGWMDDPTAPGGRRPKKAPGRGRSRNTRDAPAPPSNRRANQPRTAPAAPSPVIQGEPPRSYPDKIGELLDSAWMVSGAIPVTRAKVMGFDLYPVTLKANAQGAVIADNRPGLVQGMATLAQHSSTVRRIIDTATADNGPGWILPACVMLAPFVAQTAQLWRGGVEAAAPLAERTHNEFTALVKAMGLPPADAERVDQAAAATQAPGWDAFAPAPPPTGTVYLSVVRNDE